MNEISEMDLDLALENELRLELENLDRIFMETTANSNSNANSGSPYNNPGNSPNTKPSRLSYSAYDLAEAEIEKEELQDKLRLILSKTEEFDKEFMELNEINHELKSKNEKITCENLQLKDTIQELEQKLTNEASLKAQEKTHEYQQLEFRLAETKSVLAKYLQLYEDMAMTKEIAVVELEREKLHRIHVEKERDAYSAAYEASLQHFEKWSKTQKKSLVQYHSVSRSQSGEQVRKDDEEAKSETAGPSGSASDQKIHSVHIDPSTTSISSSRSEGDSSQLATPSTQRPRLSFWSSAKKE